MPLFQYFGWVGSFLLAALLATNWCLPAPIGLQSGVPLDQKISIRIHTDHKWPERVVLDTTSSMPAQQAGPVAGTAGSEPVLEVQRQTMDAFAEMAAIPVRPCFGPRCSAVPSQSGRSAPSWKAAPSQVRARLAAGADLTSPSRPHKPPGKS